MGRILINLTICLKLLLIPSNIHASYTVHISTVQLLIQTQNLLATVLTVLKCVHNNILYRWRFTCEAIAINILFHLSEPQS